MKVKSKNEKGAQRERESIKLCGQEWEPHWGGVSQSNVRFKHWRILRSTGIPTFSSPLSLHFHWWVSCPNSNFPPNLLGNVTFIMVTAVVIVPSANIYWVCLYALGLGSHKQTRFLISWGGIDEKQLISNEHYLPDTVLSIFPGLSHWMVQ